MPKSPSNGSLYLGGAFVEVSGRPAPYLARVRYDGINPRLEAPVWIESGVHLTLRGFPGMYSLESSPGLHTWAPLATVTNLTGTVEFADPEAALFAQKFCRVIQP